jgi:hypothetical protein
METIYDWVTVGIFAGLIVLFLQRSVGPERDRMWPYFAAAVGCAVVNQIGNKALDGGGILYHVLAAGGLAAIIAFILLYLHPFGSRR